MTFAGMSEIKSDRPLGSFKKNKSLILVSEKIENPTEHMAKTRLLILNSGKIDVSNKYSFVEDGWYPIGGLLIVILKTVLFIEDSIIS